MSLSCAFTQCQHCVLLISLYSRVNPAYKRMVVALLIQILNIFIIQVWEGLGVVKTCRDILGETDPVSNSHQMFSKRNEICAVPENIPTPPTEGFLL